MILEPIVLRNFVIPVTVSLLREMKGIMPKKSQKLENSFLQYKSPRISNA
jgi:hypothetical protein